MMMMVVVSRVQFAKVHKPRKLIKVEHRLILAVLAEERDVLAEVHIL